MKQLIILILLSLTALNLQSTSFNEREYSVAFAQDTLEDEYRQAQIESLSEALKRHKNIKFEHSNADSSISMQIMQIEDFIMRGVDVLLISPQDENITTKLIDQAYYYEIPVILLNRELNNSNYGSYIKTDDFNITKDTNQTLNAIFNILTPENQGANDEQ